MRNFKQKTPGQSVWTMAIMNFRILIAESQLPVADLHMIQHEQKLSNPFRQGTHATITGAVEKAVFETSHPQDEGSKNKECPEGPRKFLQIGML